MDRKRGDTSAMVSITCNTRIKHGGIIGLTIRIIVAAVVVIVAGPAKRSIQISNS